MHYTSSSSPYQPPNHRNDSHHPPQPIKMPKSLFKRKPKPNHKSLQHHFSESATSSSEPKPPILSKPLPSLWKWLVTHQELRKRKSLPKGSKVNAPKFPSIVWTHGSQMKERRLTTSLFMLSRT